MKYAESLKKNKDFKMYIKMEHPMRTVIWSCIC